MELGNFIFGNSKGKYPISRGCGFEKELSRLFDSYAPDRDNSWREYGEEFENEIFFVFPYYWGDCTCGYEEADNFNEQHLPNCYQSKKKEIERKWAIKKNKLEDFNKFNYFSEFSLDDVERELFDKEIEDLCNNMDLSYPHGCAVHCTCDYDKRYVKYLKQIGYFDGHKDTCLLVKPNFYYKPEDLEINWYKYPLRDSYMNKHISLSQFRKIIDKCIESIKE